MYLHLGQDAMYTGNVMQEASSERGFDRAPRGEKLTEGRDPERMLLLVSDFKVT